MPRATKGMEREKVKCLGELWTERKLGTCSVSPGKGRGFLITQTQGMKESGPQIKCIALNP